MSARAIERRLHELSNADAAALAQRFFKTGPGQYGEGDRFLGIRVPLLRKVAKEFASAALEDALALLRSPWHESRFVALLLLMRTYERGDETTRDAVYRAYLANTASINNWDLVDVSAPRIVGRHLQSRSRRPLHRLARSKSLWERRIGILSTLYFIVAGEVGETLRIATMLLDDEEDLIHKAAGWMLREVGKKDRSAEERFLDEHAARMPRTMLRYAIERFPPSLRRRYMGAGR